MLIAQCSMHRYIDRVREIQRKLQQQQKRDSIHINESHRNEMHNFIDAARKFGFPFHFCSK